MTGQKNAAGDYTGLGTEADSEQKVTLVIKNDKMMRSRPWTARVSNNEIIGGLVGWERTLREAKHLAELHCTRGLDIQE